MKLLGLSISIGLVLCAATANAKPLLDRVNATNSIRCGYLEYYPALTHDAASDTWKGFNADIIKAIASKLELKYEFSTATGWATVVEDLHAGKFDMLCSGFWVHPNVGKFALFSKPFMYQPVFVIARANDTRFNEKTNLNDPALKMVALDGDNPVNIAAADFPRAQVMTLPNMTDFSQVLVNVADAKADFTIVDAYTFGAYNKNNPGKLRIVDPKHPVRVYPVSYVFGKDDIVFRDAVNAALDELILDGSINKILDKYDDFPFSYYRPSVPFTSPY